jgi:hypothetical protein
MYADHYYAHWLLTEAIKSSSMIFAFCAMHNKDTKLGRIEESDLIPSDDFQAKMEQRSIKIKELFNSVEWKETIGRESERKKK